VHVVAFSSAYDLPEQVASIRSFLRHVGTPLTITVVSDGSHDTRQRSLLERLHTKVTVTRYDDFARSDLPDAVLSYADVHPMGKKLMVLASLPSLPALYVDSDVLFFSPSGGQDMRQILIDTQTRYLTQGWSVGYDMNVLPEQEGAAVNAGFLLVAEQLDWAAAFAYMPDRVSSADIYLEQTLVHIAIRAIGGQPLPSDRFAIHRVDQFEYRDLSGVDGSVLRHYVSITRHKFWLALLGSSFLAARLSRRTRFGGC